ncbi:MAG: metal-dependent hydrolase [Planctomycetes bacterium]|nr:metal-dependent hydrolase [Planctomycetota bacterium]
MADILTHYTSGRLAGVVLEPRKEIALVAGVLMPDIISKSMMFIFQSKPFYSAFSHSIVGAVMYSALFCALFVRRETLNVFFPFMVVGYLIHILFDAFKDYLGFGVVYPFLPFSQEFIQLPFYNPYNSVYLIPADILALLIVIIVRQKLFGGEPSRANWRLFVGDLWQSLVNGLGAIKRVNFGMLVCAAMFFFLGRINNDGDKSKFDWIYEYGVMPKKFDGREYFFECLNYTRQLKGNDFEASYRGRDILFLSETSIQGDSSVIARYDYEKDAFKLLDSFSLSTEMKLLIILMTVLIFAVSCCSNNSLLLLTRYLLFPYLCLLVLVYFFGTGMHYGELSSNIFTVLCANTALWFATNGGGKEALIAASAVLANSLFNMYVIVWPYFIL